MAVNESSPEGLLPPHGRKYVGFGSGGALMSRSNNYNAKGAMYSVVYEGIRKLSFVAQSTTSVVQSGTKELTSKVLPVEVTELPLLEKLHLDNNKLSLLPLELGDLRNLKVLIVDNNMLVSVPVDLRHCVGLVELSLEHNKLIRPLLDFRGGFRVVYRGGLHDGTKIVVKRIESNVMGTKGMKEVQALCPRKGST